MTNHLSHDELVLYFYGEADAGTSRHVAECAQCRAQFEELSRLLKAVPAAVTPERPDDYGTQVWNRIRAHLPEAPVRRPWWQLPQRWGAIAAVAALVIVAFLAGRFYPGGKSTGPQQTASAQQVRERVLLLALGDHLDRSQMLLVELTHAPASGEVALLSERQRADDLIASNRLYRQTALSVGDTSTAAVLDELERVLVDIAHQPTPLNQAQLQEIQQRIESQGLLFKVRVVQSNVQSQIRPSPTQDKPPTARPAI